MVATGPGNPPVVRFLGSGSVRFGSKSGLNPNCFVLAGLLPGPDIDPPLFGQVVPGPRFHCTGPATFAPIKYLSSDRIMI